MPAAGLHAARRARADRRGMDIAYVALILVLFGLVGLMAVGVDRL
jgi:hypothetical protein